MDEADERNLRRAIELAAAARQAGDMPFGSLLVGPAGDVLAEDRNTVLSDRDITAHPELKLARWAARELPADIARATTMYTSCEPCPMCRGAIARSGLRRVVFALSGAQLDELRPPGVAGPDAADVRYEGPALLEQARVPVDGYYD
jgi:tRNA(Arg) A34 adenosine deaminase TadA